MRRTGFDRFDLPVGAGFSSNASCSVNESADRGFVEGIVVNVG